MAIGWQNREVRESGASDLKARFAKQICGRCRKLGKVDCRALPKTPQTLGSKDIHNRVLGPKFGP